jgi:hypothetical protein
MFRRFRYVERDHLRQHALDRREVARLILRQCLVDLAGEGFRIVNGCLYLGLRPTQMPGDGAGLSIQAANVQRRRNSSGHRRWPFGIWVTEACCGR